MSMDIHDLWQDYKLNPGTPARKAHQRNELILHYTSLVRAVASRLYSLLPNTIERDDLISYGTFGLIDAIEKFDVEKGVKFETYAIQRIRGGMLDGLRKQDWVPRKVRSKSKELDRTEADLHCELGRKPEDAELAERMGVTVVELWAIQADSSAPSIGALDEHDGDDDRPSISDSLADVSEDPEELLIVDELAAQVAAAIELMPERAKTILALYYLEELTLAEIGQLLGVTETRVCQLQGRILHDLRGALAGGVAGLAA